MKPPLQSVSSSVSNDFFSKTAHRVFMKFGMKLWCLKGKKWQIQFSWKKIIFWRKSPKISPEFQNRVVWSLQNV